MKAIYIVLSKSFFSYSILRHECGNCYSLIGFLYAFVNRKCASNFNFTYFLDFSRKKLHRNNPSFTSTTSFLSYNVWKWFWWQIQFEEIRQFWKWYKIVLTYAYYSRLILFISLVSADVQIVRFSINRLNTR